MTSQLMTQLNNMMKYQQDKAMIIKLVLYQILLILKKKKKRLIAADLSKQKALNADSRAMQQIIFTGKVSENILIYYILEKSKETILEFSKGTINVL